MYVLLGNTAPIEMRRRDVSGLSDDEVMDQARRTFPNRDVDSYDVDTVRELLAEDREAHSLDTVNGQSITQVTVPEGMGFGTALSVVKAAWATQSRDALPAWVECSDEGFAGLLAEDMRREAGADTPEIPLKAPADWMHDDKGNAPWRAFPGLTMIATLASLFMLACLVLATRMQLRTNAGRDFQSRVMGDGVAAGAGTGTMRPADYLAITENAVAPALSDTTLTGELTAGGLGRAQAAYTHTAASTTYTLIYEWTSSDGTSRTINKMGVFNASSAGTMVFESLVPSPPTLVAGDKLQITSTIDIS